MGREIDTNPGFDIENITIKGAREHNLKNVSVKVPRKSLVVITGLSGSGKSSLAFDTLYAEGQRRYVECLSPYARQFLGMLKKPDVDVIDGLSPAISIEQKSITHNPRSTVGIITEIYDYLRLLYAKIGVQYCVNCGIEVQQKSLDHIAAEINKNFANKRIIILAPLVKGRKGQYKDLFEQLIKSGFTKVRIDGEISELSDDLLLNRYKIHNIELVVDRCIVNEKNTTRIIEGIELAVRRSEGVMTLLVYKRSGSDECEEIMYSTSSTCPKCGRSYPALAPNLFSFNSAYGACPSCEGLGESSVFDEDLVIPDKNISIADGGILPIGKERDVWIWNSLSAFCKNNGIDIHKPISELSHEQIDRVLYGSSGNDMVKIKHLLSNRKSIVYTQKFIGVLPTLYHHFEHTSSLSISESYEQYMKSLPCEVCGGARLKQESLAVKIDGKSIYEMISPDIDEVYNYFCSLPEKLTDREMQIVGIIIKEIRSRLSFLKDVGLGYISLTRPVRTLSGGESQRIRLASQIGSELSGVMYVLDEPSIGLHQHDNDKLISSLKKLRDLGNSVIVVEHDKSMMIESDYIIDIGPKAGVLGGNIMFARKPSELNKLPKSIIEKSLTAQYLLGLKDIEYSQVRRSGSGKHLILRGATGNNLKNVTLDLPLGKIICITGKSGSGKSSLVNDTLYPILSKHFYRSAANPLPYQSIEGLENIDKVVEINQLPIGRTPRSNPVTYTGIFTQIREFFSALPESKARGYKAGRFSFNVKGGRCEACEGGGIKKIEMNFLPEVYVECDVCNGKRYNEETLAVKFKGKTIADVLDMTVDEAVEYFSEIPKIKRKIDTLKSVGLGYIKLGQQAPTLSGGEAQRVKLATELSKTNTGNTLYLLDEPTTGLHFEDIKILLNLLNKLADKGSTIVIIEHNLDVIKASDWIIDLGPEGGENGGEILVEGTPEEICSCDRSYTAKYLKKELNNKQDKLCVE